MGCCLARGLNCSSIDESSVIARVRVARYSSLGRCTVESTAPGVIYTDGNLLEYDTICMGCCWCSECCRQSFPIANIKTVQAQSSVLTIKAEKNGIHHLIIAVVNDSDNNLDHFIQTVTRLSGISEKTVSYDDPPPPYTN